MFGYGCGWSVMAQAKLYTIDGALLDDYVMRYYTVWERWIVIIWLMEREGKSISIWWECKMI